ncbi:putative hexosyltransferase [Lupinus albus]|uniref:Alpha-1,3/1,6-mannosyltransferase ALG2 n=1 Tax=Lupinus albus TaxID=3870 RepID=A0A6A4R7G3_LUPAL|nr:putative hexosyltransferase [Lupinus albus]
MNPILWEIPILTLVVSCWNRIGMGSQYCGYLELALEAIFLGVFENDSYSAVVFYCHFPDLLLAQHSTFLWRMYRKPIDFVEEIKTGMADLILVNSNFTASTFANTFKHLNAKGIRPATLYPAVNVDQFNEPSSFNMNFLSINRFERKKNIELVISAFAMLHSPEGVLKHQDITNASLTVAGEHLFVYDFFIVDRYYGDVTFSINCHDKLIDPTQ